MELNRRDVFKLLAGAAIAPALPALPLKSNRIVVAGGDWPPEQDSTAAIQAAIDHAAAIGAAFYLRPGVYRLTDKLALRGEVYIYGAVMAWKSPGGGITSRGMRGAFWDTVMIGPEFHRSFGYFSTGIALPCSPTGRASIATEASVETS